MKRLIASLLVVSFVLPFFVLPSSAVDFTGELWSVPSSTQESQTSGFGSAASDYKFSFGYPVALFGQNGFGGLHNTLVPAYMTDGEFASNWSPSPTSVYPLSKGTYLNVSATFSVSFGTMSDGDYFSDGAVSILFYDSSGNFTASRNLGKVSPSVHDSSATYSISKIVEIPSDGIISFCVFHLQARCCTSSYISFTPGSPRVFISGSASPDAGDTIVNVDTDGIEALLAEIKTIVTSICSNTDTANSILDSINNYVIDLYDNSTNCITYLEKVENILSTQLVAINNSLKGIPSST